MKRLFCLLLILLIIITFNCIVFAVPVEPDNVGDGLLPLGPANTLNIINEETPEAPLPKTGGVPAEVFYIAGALLVGIAVVISKKKTKAE